MRTRFRRFAPLAAAFMAAVLVFALAEPGEAAQKKKKRASKKKKKAAAARVEPAAVPRPPDPDRVTIVTPDGVQLAGTWHPVPGNPGAPAVLLLHDFSRERRAWEPFARELGAKGLATLAIDLRAHGESTRNIKGGAPIHLSPRLLGSSSSFPQDVEAATRWLKERAPRVGVLGLSLGGNLAILAAANGWADAAVAVSSSQARLAPLAGTRATKPRATLILAAENDADRAASAKSLDAAALEPKRLLVLPGAAHNMALFDEPGARKAAFDWLVERLGARPPAPPTATPTPVFVPAETLGFDAPPEPASLSVLPPTATPAPIPEATPEPEPK